ncbi:MAG: acetylxylan esterase [Armatimonadota bacterium]|nr:acetylxylan esterase [Armatimonadota bacterium]
MQNDALDPTYGYDRQRLLQVSAPDGPPNFAAFWQSTFAEAQGVPLHVERRQVASPDPNVEVWEVEFDSLGGVRIGGWITVPVDGQFRRGVVVGHGYGGRSEPGLDLPGPAAVAIFPCARGFDRSAHAHIPGDAARHVLHGIARRETYVHRGCVADLWCAAATLLELFPQVAHTLHYHGASFGGGIGALALPWDTRFHKAFLDVPSFGNHPLRVQLPCTGSGESVRRYHRRHPEVLEVLGYFDAATAARHIRIPVFVAAALFDPAVPPPGQFAVYNALAGPKELFVRRTGHPDDVADNEELFARLSRWFSE